MKKKFNVIIDTDPGVDDSIANIMAIHDEKLNILLFTTGSGNRDVDTCTRNLLHILDFYKIKRPVAKGAAKPLFRERIDASFIHGSNGTGKYVPSTPKSKVIKDDAVEAMYKKIKANKGNISILLLAPQTNMATLLQRHPDVTTMISQIIFMGASAYGHKGIKPHISFNISSDPEAFQIVLNSGIPLTMIPSEIGRGSFLTEAQVESIKENKVVGKMMYEMLTGYWEPGYDDKRVAMNDSCAVFFLTHPHLFKTKKATIQVNTTDHPGKTFFNYNKNGNVNAVVKMNVKKFHKLFFKKLNKINKEQN